MMRSIVQTGAIASLAVTANTTSLPPDADYVTVNSGHLTLHGERVRYWGAIGGFPGKNRDDADAVIQRLKDMGFNMVRFWRHGNVMADYTPGDGSEADMYDYFLARMGQEGMKIWMPSIAGGTAREPDVDILNDPSTAAEWKNAVGSKGLSIWHIGIWDPRMRAIAKRNITNIANHVNKHNGLRWGDDPTIAVWELTNEQWWYGWMLDGQWQSAPEFFRRELLARWNAWLRARYHTKQDLLASWLALLPDESYEKGTIKLLPLRKRAEVDPQQKALGVDQQDRAAERFDSDNFAPHRASDVLEFLLALWLEYKQEQAHYVKTLGKSCRLGPLVWDTGLGFGIQTQYMQQQADATCHDTYITAFSTDPNHRRFPWHSGLEEQPRLCWQVWTPWVEENRAVDKPQFIYETQIEQPAKYRAEYPLEIASLGSIQDWDIVCWHYFGAVPNAKEKDPYSGALDYTFAEKGAHCQGYHYQYDEVQMSAMKAAAEIFKNRHLAPAPSPTVFIFGRKSLYDPNSIEYEGSYGMAPLRFLSTVYRYGMRILIDPGREDDKIEGPSIRLRQYEPNPIKPNDQIEYDWHKGHLILDAPGVAGYTGFFAQYGGPVRFSNGVTIASLKVKNPAGMPYPVLDDERYASVNLVSTDGKPLAECRRAILSAVSTSFNTGFEMEPSKLHAEFVWQENGGAMKSLGRLPVLVARVETNVAAPMLAGMAYTMRDWHMRQIASGKVPSGGTITVSADMPVFIVEFER